MTSLPDGKLPNKLLQELLSKLSLDDVNVKVGPALGEDAAAIDRGDHYLLLAADPITFLPKRIGWYSVQVNANDIAAMGGTPQYFLSTILLPSGLATDDMVRDILTDIASACREIGCLAVGGHTEVTGGIDRPIVAGAMVGEVERDRLVTSGGARSGDMILLTKGVAVEATAILAQEREDEIRDAFGDAFFDKASKFLDDPGLSIVRDAHAAVDAGGVTAMHDVTEGGVATALWELADASDVGLVVSESEIPRFWESAQLAERFTSTCWERSARGLSCSPPVSRRPKACSRAWRTKASKRTSSAASSSATKESSFSAVKSASRCRATSPTRSHAY